MKEQNHGWAYAMKYGVQDEDFFEINELGEPILRKCYYCGKPTSRTKNSVPTCKGCDRK